MPGPGYYDLKKSMIHNISNINFKQQLYPSIHASHENKKRTKSLTAFAKIRQAVKLQEHVQGIYSVKGAVSGTAAGSCGNSVEAQIADRNNCTIEGLSLKIGTI